MKTNVEATDGAPRAALLRTVILATLLPMAMACADQPGSADTPADFVVVARIDVGQNPHQISFSEDGHTAWIATAGEELINVVDVPSREIAGTIPVPGVPLGVVPLPNGKDLAVSLFGSGGVVRVARNGSRLGGDRGTSPGASLLSGPFPADRYLVSVEQSDSVHVFDGAGFTFRASYPTGVRPFPGSTTSDGRLAFVPGYDDGSVTVIDLFNDRVIQTVDVGLNPSGGAVLPGDIDYAVVLRGENRVAVMNTASRLIVDEITEGIGESPFSLVVTPNGRLAFVNNTGSSDISVIDLESREVIARVTVPEVPIVMAVHPSGNELWVSSEGEHAVSVISIPTAWRGDLRNRPSMTGAGTDLVTDVAVMGMTHSGHITSEVWGLEEVEAAVRAFAPDVICTEIAPDRWERIARDLRERDAIEDPRVLRFPEYREVILRLGAEMGFEVVPCAGWSLEMSDLRVTRIAEFDTEDRWAGPRAEYARRLSALQANEGIARGGASDDPAYIHSDQYDADQKAELVLYDEYQNDMIGPGGWTNINVEHYRNIDRAIRAHRGQRMLITFGGGHKYWILERLRERDDVRLLDMNDFLPGDAGGR